MMRFAPPSSLGPADGLLASPVGKGGTEVAAASRRLGFEAADWVWFEPSKPRSCGRPIGFARGEGGAEVAAASCRSCPPIGVALAERMRSKPPQARQESRSCGRRIGFASAKSSGWEEQLLFGSIPPVAIRGQAGYNLRGRRGTDRRGSTGASPYRCDCVSLGCRRINR